MTSSRPYLIRALHEWIIDNGLVPHLLVNARAKGVNVPSQHVRDGKIILNVSPSAVQHLQLGKDRVEFNARFGGVTLKISVPVSAVLAIYAKENGQGMVFKEDDTGDKPAKPRADKPAKPDLKLVT